MSELTVAVIWGYTDKEAEWQNHHQFWEATIREQPGTRVLRYTWANWQTMPTDLDLYFFCDFHPSLFRVCNYNYHPRVFYWYDCFHHSFAYPAQVVECFDRSYFSEYQTVRALRNQGVARVWWLPAAYYPGIYRPLQTAKLHHWAFVGQPDNVIVRHGLTRKEFIERLGNEPLGGYVGQGVYGADINQVYNDSMILLDRTIYNNLGTRFFETIGSGGFLLVNRPVTPNGRDSLAADGQHFISYDDSYADCAAKLKYYVQHTEERQRIAQRGEVYFRDHHTYAHRWRRILKDLGYA